MTALILSRRIAASPEAVDTLVLEIRALLAGKVGTKDAFAVELLLREQLANAVEHGNRGDVSLGVSIELDIGDGVFSARVEDQGEGFAFAKMKDIEQAEGERGRGLQILKIYADTYGWEKEGRVSWFKRTIEEGRHE